MTAEAVTVTRWTPRHPVLEVRTRTIILAPRFTVTRTEWRPEGQPDAPWIPVNPHDLRRHHVEINPPTEPKKEA